MLIISYFFICFFFYILNRPPTSRLPIHFVSKMKLPVNFQEDTCKIHQNLAVSKYFDGSGRNPPEFLNKNGNTNVPMNPNEGIRFNSTQESSKRNNTKLRI